MRIAIDAVGIRGHGAAAVLSELLYWLPIVQPEWKWHVFLFERDLREFDDPVTSDNVKIQYVRDGNTALQRMVWINKILPTHLKQLKADILFSFANITPIRPVIPQVVLCHQPNAFFSEGIPWTHVKNKLRFWYMKKQILKGSLASNALIVQTNAMRDRILESDSRLKGRIHVIPSGYRTASENPITRADIKQLVDNAPKPRLIYVAHPSEHKNHETLLKALPHLQKYYPDISLFLTLDKNKKGDKRYQKFINKYSMIANNNSTFTNIIWLGILNHDEVTYALRSSDLSVFPSLAESFGLPLVESMAAGCPIVASDLTYAHDVCGDAALYFNPKDSRDTASSITEVLNNKSLLMKLKAKGESRKSRFSYEQIARDYANIFQKCTS